MGSVWNSHLPKKGAGRPKGSIDGVRRPGIKGGTSTARSQAAKDADPLHVPGNSGATKANHAAGEAHWADVDKIAAGQRRIHEFLHEARNVDAIEKIGLMLLSKAGEGDYKSAELVLAYFAGKPVAYVSRQNSQELTGDSISKMAEAVQSELESKGLRVIKREAPPAEEASA